MRTHNIYILGDLPDEALDGVYKTLLDEAWIDVCSTGLCLIRSGLVIYGGFYPMNPCLNLWEGSTLVRFVLGLCSVRPRLMCDYGVALPDEAWENIYTYTEVIPKETCVVLYVNKGFFLKVLLT